MLRIDLNADVGESYGVFKVGHDEKLMSVITSANIACGFHSGDYNTMAETVSLAKKHGVGVGAHPGFQDLIGFGRREMVMTPEEIYRMVLYQIGALDAFCRVENIPMVHVKPHGALYNFAARDRVVAESIAQAVYDVNPKLILFGLCNSELIKAAHKIGLKTASEAFADRTYTDEGELTSRTRDNALHTSVEAMKKQVLEIVKHGYVTSVTGKKIDLQTDTICIHGDGDYAVEVAHELKKALLTEKVEIKNVGE
ncbi:5-oxoprolinase subunit PxpA [Bacillaceae bacterium S4-13-58]